MNLAHMPVLLLRPIASTPEDPRIWLLDLARDLPASTQLDGFDISTAQYPAKEHLPPNVRLRILDILADDPPKDLQNQYDIVHIRLFVGVICHGDPMPLLFNLVKLLREVSLTLLTVQQHK